MDDPILEHSYDLSRENARIIECRRCPRLVEWRERVAREKRKSFSEWQYWGKPVPHFGDPSADRLIIGLAPAAHGANRTGRLFTGDRSGDWLFRALHKAGVANQPTSQSLVDGLKLKGVMITPVCHCAPPDNKPLPSELASCSPYLNELLSSRKWKSFLCLGSIAWHETLVHLLNSGYLASLKPRPTFSHSAQIPLAEGAVLVGSYHPSQQNTFTGKLTEEMLDDAIQRFLA